MRTKLKTRGDIFKDWVWIYPTDIPNLEAIVEKAQKEGAKLLIEQIKEDLFVCISGWKKGLKIHIHLVGDGADDLFIDVGLDAAVKDFLDCTPPAAIKEFRGLLKKWSKQADKIAAANRPEVSED